MKNKKIQKQKKEKKYDFRDGLNIIGFIIGTIFVLAFAVYQWLLY